MTEALRETDRRSSPLSSRELEVADLVAEGLTNREIAQRLIISTRTVESHVDHIKAKLGFGRRARIVAWALDRPNDNGVQAQTNPGSGPLRSDSHCASRLELVEGAEERDVLCASEELGVGGLDTSQ
jgi:DNA-binding CsgD family transcriptional regulator